MTRLPESIHRTGAIAGAAHHPIGGGQQDTRCRRPMGGLGQTRSFADVGSMSVLPPKAEVDPRSCDVAKVPKGDLSNCSKTALTRSPRRRWRGASAAP